MESTTVVTSGRGTNPKTTLYVGGLDISVAESQLFAAFIPFGEIKDVTIPLDFTSGKHRGFGFVEYEETEDASAAIDNMHNSELFGRVLKVNFAQPTRIRGAAKGWSHQAAWADADKYFEDQHTAQEKTEKDTPLPTAETPETDKKAAGDEKMSPDAMQALENAMS